MNAQDILKQFNITVEKLLEILENLHAAPQELPESSNTGLKKKEKEKNEKRILYGR